jgi:hypothetical protein
MAQTDSLWISAPQSYQSYVKEEPYEEQRVNCIKLFAPGASW